MPIVNHSGGRGDIFQQHSQELQSQLLLVFSRPLGFHHQSSDDRNICVTIRRRRTMRPTQPRSTRQSGSSSVARSARRPRLGGKSHPEIQRTAKKPPRGRRSETARTEAGRRRKRKRRASPRSGRRKSPLEATTPTVSRRRARSQSRSGTSGSRRPTPRPTWRPQNQRWRFSVLKVRLAK